MRQNGLYLREKLDNVSERLINVMDSWTNLNMIRPFPSHYHKRL
jgi:hypothetical protein